MSSIFPPKYVGESFQNWVILYKDVFIIVAFIFFSCKGYVYGYVDDKKKTDIVLASMTLPNVREMLQ